ncbi:NAD(P)-binding protein [Phlegmacium glaucopus]|nr:NAD(P)-binding protein [Phlegmacium glaucopus]
MGNLVSRQPMFDLSKDLVDLKGKVIIVTGGNTGIGFATVQHLARAGAKVYLAARNESRATGALAKLDQEGLEPGNGEVIWLKLDLSDPRDAKEAAEEFLKREKRLDVLVNNAALLRAPHVIGNDGIANMTMVNYLSPYVFTRTLLPLLQQTAKESDSDVRIVNVASIVHKFIPSSAKFSDISDFNVTFRGRLIPGLMRYGHTKLMMILWSKTLQNHINSDPNAPITVISIHPGGVNTFTDNWPFSRFFKWLVGLAIASPTVGAYTSVFAAAGRAVLENKELYQGVYLENKPTGRIAQPSKAALDTDLANQLWTTTESLLKQIGI